MTVISATIGRSLLRHRSWTPLHAPARVARGREEFIEAFEQVPTGRGGARREQESTVRNGHQSRRYFSAAGRPHLADVARRIFEKVCVIEAWLRQRRESSLLSALGHSDHASDYAFYELVVDRLARKPTPIKERCDDRSDDLGRLLSRRQFSPLSCSFRDSQERHHESFMEACVKLRQFRVALSGIDNRGKNCRPS